jgi:hypothetical protein
MAGFMVALCFNLQRDTDRVEGQTCVSAHVRRLWRLWQGCRAESHSWWD